MDFETYPARPGPTVGFAGTTNSLYLAGYAAAGDGGAALYKRVSADPHHGLSFRSNDQYLPDGTINAANGGWWEIAENSINVKMAGAKGDGSTNDAPALGVIATYLSTGSTLLPYLGDGAELQSATILFPPGNYLYNAAALALTARFNASLVIRAIHPRTVRITNTSTDYFLSTTGCRSLVVEDIEFVGGKGAVCFPSTRAPDGVVSSMFSHFTRCRFYNYTETAIGSNVVDHPGLKVRDCAFTGGVGAFAGIAWGGYCDECEISNNDFTGNTYDIKLGGGTGTSGSWRISRNGFFSGTKPAGGISNRFANVWIGARSEVNNSGISGIIEENKFGNENRGSNKEVDTPRILFAFEIPDDPLDSSDTKYNRKHSETDKDGFITGVRIERNGFFGASYEIDPVTHAIKGEQRGIILSAINHLGITYKDNKEAGTTYPYIVEYVDAVGSLRFNNDTNSIPTIEPSLPDGAQNPVELIQQISNKENFATVSDFQGETTGLIRSVIRGTKGAGYILHAASAPAGLSASGTSTLTVLNDPVRDPNGGLYGGYTARRIAFSASSGGRYFRSTGIYDPEMPLWLEVDVRKSAVNPMDFVVVALDEYTPTFRIGMRFAVKLTTNWRTARIPVNCRIENKNLQASIYPYPVGFAAGSKDSVDVGNMRMYQASAPHDGKIDGTALMPDDAATFLVGSFPRTLLYSTTLTAARALTLSTTGALIGDAVDVIRADSGAFSLTVNSTLAVMAPGTGASFIFNGTAWVRARSWTV